MKTAGERLSIETPEREESRTLPTEAPDQSTACDSNGGVAEGAQGLLRHRRVPSRCSPTSFPHLHEEGDALGRPSSSGWTRSPGRWSQTPPLSGSETVHDRREAAAVRPYPVYFRHGHTPRGVEMPMAQSGK